MRDEFTHYLRITASEAIARRATALTKLFFMFLYNKKKIRRNDVWFTSRFGIC